jgi:Domain of unknown function (DUF3387)
VQLTQGVSEGAVPLEGHLFPSHRLVSRKFVTREKHGLPDRMIRIHARIAVRKNTTIDWTLRENVQAHLRVLVKRIQLGVGYGRVRERLKDGERKTPGKADREKPRHKDT